MHSEFFEGLKGQTISDEIIQKIQAESGKDVTAAKTKMQTQIDNLTTQISELQTQLGERDTNLNELKTQLEAAGQSSTKLGEVQKSFDELTAKYQKETQEYQSKLEKQQYEFLAKETIGGIKFSSNAAKDNFYQKLLDKNLPVENEKLLGFDDFLSTIKESDPGAFVVEEPPKKDPPPRFADPQNKNPEQQNNQSVFGFNFVGVRKQK